MYYVYILQSKKDNQFYTGHTKNIDRRLKEHNDGKVKSTKNRKPFILLYKEEFPSRSDARWREKYFKTANGKKKLRELISRKTYIPL